MITLILITLILFTGCSADEKHPVRIEKIGERDGVIIYRFNDNGDNHYYIVGKAVMLPERKRPPPIELDQGNK